MADSVLKVTYARVAKDANPAAARQRPHNDKLDAFLLEHVRALRRFANGKNSCPATFVEDEAKDLFESLRDGDNGQFLEAAHKITLRLIGQMTGATADGLLVCMQIKSEGVAAAAVLKLQVVTPNSANLETLDSGEVLLSAVTDVMDAPGKLQKGALIDDPREDSEVIMGDLANKEAQYFPRAFGISIEQRASLAAADMLEVIKELQGEQVEAAARHAMSATAPGPVVDVLDSLAQSVPELEHSQTRQAIEDRLQSRPRPVRKVDTTAPLTEVITASGITIKVPVTGHNRVTWEPDANAGGFVISIRVDEQPRREIR